MREFVSKIEYEIIKELYKKDKQCCFVKLNGKKIKTKEQYFEKLKKKLQLNESFSNNYNAYSDMMRDGYTYFNKEKIIFVIKHYDEFLSEDTSKNIIENIFDQDIIPFFAKDIEKTLVHGSKKDFHVYCVR